MKTTIEQMCDAEGISKEDVGSLTPSSKDTVADVFCIEWSLFKFGCENARTPEQVTYFVQNISELNLDKDFCSEIIWKLCFNLNRYDLLDALLSVGYKLPKDGNVVRQAIYAGDLATADILLKHGYKPPTTLTAFQISNQLSWKFDRLEYLLNAGTELDISDEFKRCIRLILDKCDSSAMNNDVELS